VVPKTAQACGDWVVFFVATAALLHQELSTKGVAKVEEREQQGTVKWFSDAKGYGFISRQGREDVFVHYTAIEADGFRTLREGQQVEFDVEQGPKGLQAVRVRLLSQM
jgi:CspA family cold shock protein